jgi:polar amino acid transport system substrate-binding protein
VAAWPDGRVAARGRAARVRGFISRNEDNNMISKLLKFVMAGAALAMLGAVTAHADVLSDIRTKGVLVVGTKADYRPFGYLDPSGKIIGFEPDLAADLAHRLGVKLELVPVVASNRIQFLQQGKIDLMIATTSDTPDRRKIIDFVDPNYYGSGTNVMALRSAKLKTWGDLKGKKVCLIQGSFYNKELQEKYGIEGVAFPGTAEAYAALKNGNCVAFAYDDTAIIGQLQTPEWTAYEMPLDSILFQPWGIGVKKGEDKLLKFVSEATINWHKTGFIERLEKKWGIKPTKWAEEMHAKYK